MALNKDTTEVIFGIGVTPFLYQLGRTFIIDMALPFVRNALVGTAYYIAQRQGAEEVTKWLHNYREHHKKHPTNP